LPFIWLVLIIELYDVYKSGNLRATISGIAGAAVVGFLIYSSAYFLPTEPQSLPRRGVPVFLVLASVLTLAWRFVYIQIISQPAFQRRAVVVGAGRASAALFQMLSQLERPPFHVVGVIDDDPAKSGTTIMEAPVLGSAEILETLVAEENITDVIVAISGEMRPRMLEALINVQEGGREIIRMQTVYEDLLGRVPIFHQEADWILRSFVDQSRVSSLYLLAKRVLDITGGLIGSLGVLLVFPLVALGNLLETGWPVFYTQTRSGRSGKPYEVIKFRTMHQNAEKNGRAQWASEDDDRVTRVGKLLRKTHLDELPQFINVLLGDMSLVGPRPERPELVTYFQGEVPFYRARLLVKPGISGWAQVHQDYASNIEETNVKLEYDLYYIKHRTLWLDLIVLLRTPATVVGFRGR